MNNKKLLMIAAVIAILIAIPVGWYLISPLFIDQEINEAFPTAEALMDDEMIAKATAEMESAMEAPDTVMAEEMPAEDMSTMQVLAQGSFYDIAHHGMGTATFYQLEDGSRILRFEDFEVLNGPELRVYLAPIDPVPDTVGVNLEGSIDLGLLKGNIGDQNYELPPGLDLAQYQSVVIWCEPFRVPFNAAPITAQ